MNWSCASRHRIMGIMISIRLDLKLIYFSSVLHCGTKANGRIKRPSVTMYIKEWFVHERFETKKKTHEQHKNKTFVWKERKKENKQPRINGEKYAKWARSWTIRQYIIIVMRFT